MTHLSKDGILGDVKRRTPGEGERAEKIDLGLFTADDFEETIRKDVETLKGEKMLDGMDVLGFAFITETGELKAVE